MPPATLIRVAMVFLGGVFIPIAVMPSFLQVISYLLPITYAVNILQQATTGQLIGQALTVDVAALIIFMIIFFAASRIILKKKVTPKVKLKMDFSYFAEKNTPLNCISFRVSLLIKRYRKKWKIE